jgi:hypothetical protein
LSVIVLWEPMLAGDARGAIPTKLFDDPRVTSFWDPQRISGTWFGNHGVGDLEGGIVWDAYYAFTPTSRWRQVPDDVVATGAPVIGATGGLEQSFVPLLG